MTDGIKVGIVINQEKLSDGKAMFVAHCNSLNVSSQGNTFEEVKKNIKEAIDIEIEECPEVLDRFVPTDNPVFTTFEVHKYVEDPNIVGPTVS